MFVNLLEAELAAEQVKLALEVIGLEEQGAAGGLGDGALREGRASPHPPSTGLRTGFETALRASSGRAGEETGLLLDDEEEEGKDEEGEN